MGDDEEDDGTEEVESEETDRSGRSAGRSRSTGSGGAADEDDTGDEDAAQSDEEVKDPVAKAVAQAEARMRHKYLKPLRAEVEKLKRDAGNANAAVDTVRSLQMENRFLRLAADTFHDSDAAFKLADLNGVTLADDGTVTGMEAVIDKLIESHPYLVRDASGAEDDDTWTAPDLPSGRPTNTQRKPDPKANDAVLLRRYPALQRRRGW